MDTKQRKLRIYLFLFSFMTIIATTLRTIASFTQLNEYGYYSDGLFPASAYLVAIGVLLMLSYAVIYRADSQKQAHFGGPLTYAPGVPLALCLVLLGITFLQKKAAAPMGRALFLLIALLAIAGALYFLLAVLQEQKLSNLRAIFSMACTLFLILYAGYLYFDAALPINAHTKICDQTAYVFAAVFFLFETRISLGREKWPLYTAFGLVAATLTAYSAIPSLLVYLFDGRTISNSIEETLVTLFLFAYILCRTVLSFLLNNGTATPLMTALHEDAALRREEIASHGPLPFEPQPKATPTEQAAESNATPDESDATEAEEPEKNEIDGGEGDKDPSCAQEDNNEENFGN